MSNLQTHYHFKLDFQNATYMRQVLIHGIERHKDNPLQNLELPCRIS